MYSITVKEFKKGEQDREIDSAHIIIFINSIQYSIRLFENSDKLTIRTLDGHMNIAPMEENGISITTFNTD